ncbi:MAG: fatty acyl-AMP ligase [Synechococcaceae cyanobacterium RL_1_2]|nr:fatty acyl-AMP ligase [Synechococcaceae cyanobacterium RL_1_2]
MKFSNFLEVLSFRVQAQPDNLSFTFLADGETLSHQLTFKELVHQAQAIATELHRLQAQGERALLLYQPGLDFIVSFLGCLYAGVVPVPAYPPKANKSLGRLTAIINSAEVKFALTTHNLLASIQQKLTDKAEFSSILTIASDRVPALNGEFTEFYRPQANDLAFCNTPVVRRGIPRG